MIIETICPTAFKLEKENNHGDMVQFSLILQRFKQEVGGEQGHAAKQTQETID